VKPIRLGLLGLLAATALLAGSAVGREPVAQTTWYAIVAEGGERIGHASREITAGPEGRRIVEVQDVSLQERRSPLTRILSTTSTREDAAGRAVLIRSETKTGDSETSTEARIGVDAATITRQTASGRRSATVALPPTIRFDGGEALLRGWDPAATPQLAFDSLNVDAMAVERVVIEVLPGAPASTDGGMTILRRRYEGGELRSVARLTLDRDRRVTAVTQPMFGASITIRPADKATALAPHPPYRVLPGVMTKSPFRIPPSAVLGHIRYRFNFVDGLAFALPATGEQRVAAGPEAASVDICDGCGPGLPTDAAYLADARRPTAWLQSDDPRLLAIAGPVGRMKVSDTRKMEILLRKARPYMGRIDFAGHYSALETIERRAGDCTEAAVLLAALGRTAGIPTRVVNGLVYSRERYHGVSNAFMPHSWTLAYVDGQWRSFDLALDTFDSTHIALTVGDGDMRSVLAAGQLSSLLRWDSMTEVRTRPGS